MTESLQAQIRKEAEEKYPLYSSSEIDEHPFERERIQMRLANVEARTQREAYIAGATKWGGELEKIREELIQRCNRWYGQPSTSHAQAGRYAEANDILSIIDKHLKE